MKRKRPRCLNGMRRDRAAGMTIAAIAAKYLCTQGVAWYWTESKSFQPTERQRAIEERNARAVMMLLRGMSLKQVAHACGVSYANAWYIARQNGVRRQVEIARDRHARWLRRWEAGESYASISRAENAPVNTVRDGVLRTRKRKERHEVQ